VLLLRRPLLLPSFRISRCMLSLCLRFAVSIRHFTLILSIVLYNFLYQIGQVEPDNRDTINN